MESNNPSSFQISQINWSKVANRLILIIGIGIIVNLAFNYFFTGTLQINQLFKFRWWSLLAAFFLAIVPWFFHALEIMIWSNFFKVKMPLKDAIGISVATDLGSAITPTMVGGAPIKLGMLMRKGLNVGQAGAMVIFTGIEDMVFFLSIISVSIVYSDRMGIGLLHEVLGDIFSDTARTILIISIAAISFTIIWFLLKRFKIIAKIAAVIKGALNDFKQAMTLIAKNGKTTFLLAALAIVLRWVARFFILVVLAAGIGATADWKEIYLSEWLVYMGMTITPTPGAIGGAEGGFMMVYKNIISNDVIGAVMAAWRFFNYYLLLIISAAYLYFYSRSKAAQN